MTELFFIAARTCEDNFDLFVEANNKKQALQFWHQWLWDFAELESWDPDDEAPVVFLIPAPSGKPRYYDWHGVGGVQKA